MQENYSNQTSGVSRFTTSKGIHMDKREAIAQTLGRTLGQLSLKDLQKIHDAEMKSWRASQQLGINAQVAAQNNATIVKQEIISGLSDYQIDRIFHDLKTTIREVTA
jgi:hypothetical protein